MTFAAHILSFYRSLKIPHGLPEGVEVMYPHKNEVAYTLCERFYTKFYNDTNIRALILGINPGRFGGGVTGIPFTDPIKLEEKCGLKNTLKKQAELSADFIYAMIGAWGGPALFYEKFYISAISPLGFVKEGKNLNYYDSKELTKAVEPFIIESIEKQFRFGIHRQVCFCLGEDENFRYLEKLNARYNFFDRIQPLAHPRFIMQYKRKLVPYYIQDYVKKLGSINH